MLKSLKTKFGQIVKNKLSFKVFWLFTLSFVFTFGILSPSIIPFTENSQNIVYAEDTDTVPVLTPKLEKGEVDDSNLVKPSEKQTGIAEVVSLLVSIATPAVIIMTDLAGALLSNDWVYGKAGDTEAKNNMSEVLKNMWIIMRDIVNIIFILVLLAIAFVTVLGAGTPLSEKVNYKTLLPKLAIALVVVNFTWFGAKIIIDASTVATHAVFGLLQTVAENLQTKDIEMCIPVAKKDADGKVIVKAVTIRDKIVELKGEDKTKFDNAKANATKDTKVADPLKKAGTGEEDIAEDTKIKCEDLPKEYPKYSIYDWESYTEKIGNKMDATALLKLFAYGIWHIELLPLSIDTNVTISSLAINSIFSFVFMIMIMIVLFTLLVALLVRVVMLWLNIVLSPIFALFWVVGDMGIPTGDADGNIGIIPFIKFAFLPAMIALPMVIGIIMIMAGQNLTKTGSTLVGDLEITEVINGVNSIDQLFWYLMALIVMWGSTEVATKNGGKLTEMIVQPVKDGVTGMAKFAGKSLTYIPFIPTKSADGKENMQVGVGNFLDGIKRVPNAFAQDQAKKTEKLMGFDIPSYDKLKGDIGRLAQNLDKGEAEELMKLAKANNTPEKLISAMEGSGKVGLKELARGLRTDVGKTQDIGQLLDTISSREGVARQGDNWITGADAGKNAAAGAGAGAADLRAVGDNIKVSGDVATIYGKEFDVNNITEPDQATATALANLASDKHVSVEAMIEQVAREFGGNTREEEADLAKKLANQITEFKGAKAEEIAKRINES